VKTIYSFWFPDCLPCEEKPIQNLGYIKEDSNPCEGFKAVISKKSLLGFRVFVKPCALLYTSLDAAIDYQST